MKWYVIAIGERYNCMPHKFECYDSYDKAISRANELEKLSMQNFYKDHQEASRDDYIKDAETTDYRVFDEATARKEFDFDFDEE